MGFDGSHTPAVWDGEQVAYQGRKKRKTAIAMYLTDSQGISLAMPETVAGGHNDLYVIVVQFEVVTVTLEEADICFNKRNRNRDTVEYFDQDLYDRRYAVERTNGWMDSYRSLLNRFDATNEIRKGFNYLVFIEIALKKFKKKNKEKF